MFAIYQKQSTEFAILKGIYTVKVFLFHFKTFLSTRLGGFIR